MGTPAWDFSSNPAKYRPCLGFFHQSSGIYKSSVKPQQPPHPSYNVLSSSVHVMEGPMFWAKVKIPVSDRALQQRPQKWLSTTRPKLSEKSSRTASNPAPTVLWALQSFHGRNCTNQFLLCSRVSVSRSFF